MVDDTLQIESRLGFLVPVNKLLPEGQSRLLATAVVLELKRKEVLFEQGASDEYSYYVLTGEIHLYADGSLIKQVVGGEGTSFQPLAQLQPRQMSAIAKGSAKVLRLNRTLLDQLLSMDSAAPPAGGVTEGVEVEELAADVSGAWLTSILQSELFARIPPSNMQKLLDLLEPTLNLFADAVALGLGQTGMSEMRAVEKRAGKRRTKLVGQACRHLAHR